MKKIFSVLKIKSKYIWDVYLCDVNVPLSWPTKKYLTLESFQVLPLYHKDKELSKGVFPPVNGVWPYKQIDTNAPQSRAANEQATSMLPIIQSIENGSKYMGESMVAALGKSDKAGRQYHHTVEEDEITRFVHKRRAQDHVSDV